MRYDLWGSSNCRPPPEKCLTILGKTLCLAPPRPWRSAATALPRLILLRFDGGPRNWDRAATSAPVNGHRLSLESARGRSSFCGWGGTEAASLFFGRRQLGSPTLIRFGSGKTRLLNVILVRTPRGRGARAKPHELLDALATHLMSDPTQHVPVLLREVLDLLAPQPGQVFVDGTLGGGGHTRALAERVGKTGAVIALDRDPAAIQRAAKPLAGLPVHLVESNYCDLPEVLAQLKFPAVDGILLDLGVSSDQLSDDARGFSFQSAGALDLRMNPHEGEPAAKLVNRLSAEHLANLIYEYGEERYSRRIARAIVDRRRQHPIKTSAELAEIIRSCVPARRSGERIDPATRTFQALRIAVNDELGSLEIGLQRLPGCLKPGGRLAIISFHSLEDRRVKESFRNNPDLEVITRKPVRATESEIRRNPRSRSAKLRVAARR